MWLFFFYFFLSVPSSFLVYKAAIYTCRGIPDKTHERKVSAALHFRTVSAGVDYCMTPLWIGHDGLNAVAVVTRRAAACCLPLVVAAHIYLSSPLPHDENIQWPSSLVVRAEVVYVYSKRFSALERFIQFVAVKGFAPFLAPWIRDKCKIGLNVS